MPTFHVSYHAHDGTIVRNDLSFTM